MNSRASAAAEPGLVGTISTPHDLRAATANKKSAPLCGTPTGASTDAKRRYAVSCSRLAMVRTLRISGPKYSRRKSQGTPRAFKMSRFVAWRQVNPFSTAWMVRVEMPALRASWLCVQPSACRAARILFMTSLWRVCPSRWCESCNFSAHGRTVAGSIGAPVEPPQGVGKRWYCFKISHLRDCGPIACAARAPLHQAVLAAKSGRAMLLLMESKPTTGASQRLRAASGRSVQGIRGVGDGN